MFLGLINLSLPKALVVVRSKTVVILLVSPLFIVASIVCLCACLCLLLFFFFLFFFCDVATCIRSNLAIISERKRELAPML